MQILKFINMEPPSAAVHFFHLGIFPSLVEGSFRRSFVFICIPQRSSSTAKAHGCSCPAIPGTESTLDHVQIMGLSVCTIYCPPKTGFFSLRLKFFLRKSICIPQNGEKIHHLATAFVKYCQYLAEHASFSLLHP